MNPRELFMLGSRLLGVWILYQGLGALTTYVLYMIGYRSDTTDVSKGYLIYACVDISLSYYLLLGTHHLAKLVYGEKDLPKEVRVTESASEADAR